MPRYYAYCASLASEGDGLLQLTGQMTWEATEYGVRSAYITFVVPVDNGIHGGLLKYCITCAIGGQVSPISKVK